MVDIGEPINDESTEEDSRLLAYFDSLLIRDISFLCDDSDDHDDDYPLSYFAYNSPVHFSSAPEGISSDEFESDLESKYKIQNKFVSQHLEEISRHKISRQKKINQLESVYAKRMHFRYLKSTVENLIELINLRREEYDDIIQKIKSEPKKKSMPRLLNGQWRENKNYQDFYFNLQMKRRFLLLLRAYSIINYLNSSYCVKSFFVKRNKRYSIKKIMENLNKNENIAKFARDLSYIKGKLSLNKNKNKFLI